MHPVVAGSLWTSWPSTTSTMTDDAPQVHASDCLAGAGVADATVAIIKRHTTKSAAGHFTLL
jgi:hypothetical protein